MKMLGGYQFSALVTSVCCIATDGCQRGNLGHLPSSQYPPVAATLLLLIPQLRTCPSASAAFRLCAMYGRRPRCKRNLTFPRMVGCGHVFGLLLQPLWPLGHDVIRGSGPNQ